MGRKYSNGDYCSMTQFLTGMMFDDLREQKEEYEKLKSQPVVVEEQAKANNITININVNKDDLNNSPEKIEALIRSVVDKLR